MNGIKIINKFESLYPKNLAYNWDNVGLQIGTLDKEVDKILLTLDVTQEVIDEAIKNEIDLIIAHHPLIFSAIKSIQTNTYQGNIIKDLIKNDITLYIAHTNFDISNHGMDSMLANMLNLTDLENLDDLTDNEGLGKIGYTKETNILDYIKHVKTVFQVEHVRYIGDTTQTVKRVAISGGSGSSNMLNALHKKADIFITGDISYHKALDAKSMRLNTLDIGHYIEHHFMYHLKKELINEGIDSEIITSEIDTHPYTFL